VFETNKTLNAGDFVFENIVLNHVPPPETYTFFRTLILLVLFVLILYPITYYCRKQHCKVCNKKLILFVDRCYICRFVEAEPPNEFILKALEEKGLHMQGEFPEAIPGLEKATSKVWLKLVAAGRSFLALFKRQSQVAAVEAESEQIPKAETKDNHEEWLDEIYNYSGSLEKPAAKKKPTLQGTGAAPSKDKRKPDVSVLEPKFSSLTDRALLEQKLANNEIDPYVIYKAINHPFIPAQPLGLGRQNKEWKKAAYDES
jgi:hypothetical protein